jgi:hypothetical protein
MNYQHAQEMVAYGFPVLPVDRNTKRPLVRSGGVYKATTDDTVTQGWWQRYPNANVGVHPGAHPLNLLACDFDKKHGGLETYARMVKAGLIYENTPRVATGGGGKHVFLRAPQGVRVKNKNGSTVDWSGYGLGVDVKSWGGYVIAPGSLHSSGVIYGWEVTPDQGDYPEIDPYLLERLTTTTAKADNPSVARERAARLGDYGLLSGEPEDTTGSAAGLVKYLHYASSLPPICALLGIPLTSLGVPFRCVIPGHEESNPSATLIKAKAGHVKYFEFHEKGQFSNYLQLAEVYHARHTGQLVRLDDCSLARWTAKLLVDSGVVPLAPVNLLPFPPGTNPTINHYRVCDLYRYCMGLRKLIGDTHMPFSASFIAYNSEVARSTAARIMQDLIEWKILRKVELLDTTPRKMWTYAPWIDATGSGLYL